MEVSYYRDMEDRSSDWQKNVTVRSPSLQDSFYENTTG